jgi:hypothetical protein
MLTQNLSELMRMDFLRECDSLSPEMMQLLCTVNDIVQTRLASRVQGRESPQRNSHWSLKIINPTVLKSAHSPQRQSAPESFSLYERHLNDWDNI